MSIATTRAKFIREKMMQNALFGDMEKPGRFDAIYGFISFVNKGNGNLRAHPHTGEDPQRYAERNLEAAEAYRKAVDQWATFREKKRQEYLEK